MSDPGTLGTRSMSLTSPRPAFGPGEAATLAREHFGLEGRLRELPSERDRNFLITTSRGEMFVFKIAQADDPPAVLDLQHRALEWIAARAPTLALPGVLCSRSAEELATIRAADGTRHLLRVLTWIPGRVLARIAPQTPELLRSLGLVVGAIDAALTGFSHPAARRELKWDLSRSPWTREHLDLVPDRGRRARVEVILDRFDAEVGPVLGILRRGVIHNDPNDWNVVVQPVGPYDRRVAGLVDFGDMVESAVVADPAIACAYAMLGKRDPVAAAAAVIAGYHRAHPLTEEDLAVVWPLALTRLAVSVINSALQRTVFPEEEYLQISEAAAWETIERVAAIHPRLAHYVLRGAADLEPCPASTAVRAWIEKQADAIGPLLELPPEAVWESVDLSVDSTLVETPAVTDDMEAFSTVLFADLAARGAQVGVGRWDQARILYVTGAFSAEGSERPMPRTVHLGLDLFVPAGVPVLAPLAGVVESVRDNAGFCDYGPTVILRHDGRAEGRKDGASSPPPFWTLYGHLDREVLSRLRPGMRLERGDRVGLVGPIEVNGGWPPHPHIQIICDLLDRDGEFPGVARPDQRPVWKSLSPDPNLLARLPERLVTSRHPRGPELLARRQARLGPSLSLSYRRPLAILRGWKQWLYDEDGLAYLDAVNNVAQVGHSHPTVVRAIRKQAAVLNTNTRYLHELIARYAERLTATLPEPLRVCYFVNSGSEANELAIRLARAATGRRGMVVVDGGYHGNSTTLIEVSPYKHDGPGGRGAPSWVRKIPRPDLYRGVYRRDDPGAAGKYAQLVSAALEELEGAHEPVAALLVESVLSCGGQIVLPDGFLADAYARIRAAGGLTIADEVQVGFGRVGTHFWGFETQGVVPDIVTLGKPIGNGHPMGAVITTPEIARAFANGMEFFSTFGGNPVSCAAGLAVLDVLEEEGLQARALGVGGRLLEGLRALTERRPIAGDARGLGLFLGLELVRDRSSRVPATEEASWAVNRLRDRGILLSTDGPDANVLKIKPPMCFSEADADRLVETLDQILGEDWACRGGEGE